MNGSLLADGRVIMVGGQDGSDPGSFVFAIPWVKTYATGSDAWQLLADRDGTWPVCEKVPGGFHTIHSFVALPRPGRSEQQWSWGYPGEAPVRTWYTGAA